MTESFQPKPTIYIIAGPNGAGKTTFAKKFLQRFGDCDEFLNADLIAAGLSPFAPEKRSIRASELVFERIFQLVERRVTFSFETTLAGRSYSQQIPQWRNLGFRVILIYLWLPSADLAVSRVANRVMQGGHSIPESDIRRRYGRGIRNLLVLYEPIVNDTFVYNGAFWVPPLIWRKQDATITVADAAVWAQIQNAAEEPV